MAIDEAEEALILVYCRWRLFLVIIGTFFITRFQVDQGKALISSARRPQVVFTGIVVLPIIPRRVMDISVQNVTSTAAAGRPLICRCTLTCRSFFRAGQQDPGGRAQV